MFRTGNPALKESTFRGVTRAVGEEAMTLQGTVNKTGLSLLILLAAAAFVWNSSTPQPFVLVGLVGGLIAALVTVFKPTAAPITTPLYAAFEGLLLGGLSLVFEARYPGIVINAVGRELYDSERKLQLEKGSRKVELNLAWANLRHGNPSEALARFDG